MKEFGFAIDNSDFIKLPIPTTEKLKYLEKTQNIELTDDERCRFSKIKYERLLDNFHLVKINEYTVGCLRQLQLLNVSVSYVSNARTDYIRTVLNLFGVSDPDILGNDSGLKFKPAPDMFLRIAAKHNLPNYEILVVEDTDDTIRNAVTEGFKTFKVSEFADLILLPGTINEHNYTNGRSRESI
jgi:beta-phosphoglucomutase-like phosphatase (HAD superfamily)